MKLPSSFAAEDMVHILVETPRYSRNKYVWDEETGFFRLKKILSGGLAFPANFGFIPGTRGGDRAPLDAVLLYEESLPTGILTTCRIAGVMVVQQTDRGGKTIRNDRIIAIPEISKVYKDVYDVQDIDRKWIEEINDFFAQYHKTEDTQQDVIETGSRALAFDIIKGSLL